MLKAKNFPQALKFEVLKLGFFDKVGNTLTQWACVERRMFSSSLL